MTGKLLAALLLTTIGVSPALAQDVPDTPPAPAPEEMGNRDTFTLAGGIATLPQYEGSDDYRFLPAASVRGQYHGISFSTRGLALYVDLIPDRGDVSISAGPVIGFKLGRKPKNIDDDYVAKLPRLKTAIELGGYVGIAKKGLTNPYDSLGLEVAVTRDVANAHRSTVVSPALNFSTPLSLTTFVSLSAGADFVSNRYADYYFGISPAASLASGLPAYNPSGGMKDWNLGILVNQSVTGNLLGGLSLFGTANYSRLVGDFKKSPIVSDRGSPNQWVLAAGLAYTW